MLIKAHLLRCPPSALPATYNTSTSQSASVGRLASGTFLNILQSQAVAVVLFTLFSLASTAAFGEATYHKRANWIKEHGKQASRPSSTCYDCHQPSHCTDCHGKHQELLPETKNPEAVEKTYVHRADFRSRHAGEARTDPARCVRCHTTESCRTCHTREGLTTGIANYPHPAGWLTPGSAQFHGRVARQDVALCASCHERGAATNCTVCHAPGGVGGSPHPPGWSSALPRSAPACQGCH